MDRGGPARERHLRLHEPTGFGHLVADRERVAGRVGGQGDQRRVGLGDHRERADRGDAVDDRVDRREDVGSEPLVAVGADRAGHRPGAGQRAAGLRGLHGGVEHRVAGPCGAREELRLAERGVAVQEHRGPLGRVAVLVQVHRDAGDAVDGEGPRRDVAAQPRRERQHPAADAGIDVTAHPGGGSGRRELGHGVDHPVRVRRRAGHHQHGVGIDRRRHRRHVRAVVVADLDRDRLDAEVVRGLVEGGMRGARDDHPRPGDLASCVAGALHRQQHRLGAAGGHGADRARGGVEEVGGHADHVVLHLQQRGERGRVQAVGAGIGSHRGPAQLVDLAQAGVVDVGERAAAVHRQVLGLELVEPGADVVEVHRSASVSRYRESQNSEIRVSSAGSREKPSTIAVSAESGCTASPSVEER
ncbi:hypothetical protein NODU109028_21505 [Nocardioides dubius]